MDLSLLSMPTKTMNTTWSCAAGCTTSITCLFPEILTLIFRYLDVRDKGRVAQVCTTWHEAAYNRLVWRGVQVSTLSYLYYTLNVKL